MEQRLDVAARAGDIDALYSLIKNDAYLLDRIEEVPFIDTPLHIAAFAGQVHFAMEIMRLKPSFGGKLNQNGYSPIHLALQNGQTRLVLRLLDVDRDLVRVQGREGKTPLHFAAEWGMIDLLAEFLLVCPKSIHDLTIRKESALHVAIKNDKLEALKVILEQLEHVGKDGPVLNWCDDEGNTILHVAASRNQIEVVDLLIARGVDVNAINMAGMTALDISKQPNELGNPEIRDLLSQARALEATSLPRINHSLHYLRRDERLTDAAMKNVAIKGAAKAGDTSMLYSLIREDPYILECFDDVPFVETPLHIAAHLGHFDFAREIMRWKPSFAKKPNQRGLCPVHLATINRHIQILKQFLSFDKGLVRLPGREGKTSLHFAAQKGDTLILDTLLSVCPLSIADVTDQSDTVLHVAIKYSKLEAVFFLLTVLRTAVHQGSKVQETVILNSQDENGNTLLHIAVQMNQPQVVKQLMDCRVKTDIKNTEGLTALDASRLYQAQGNTEIREMLWNAIKPHGSSVSSSVATIPVDNWIKTISWRERVVISIIRYKTGISTESRNLLLIVSTLITAIAYQTAVESPYKYDDKDISCTLEGPTNSSIANSTISCSMSSKVNLIGSFYGDFLFWLTNITALFCSLLTFLVLLPGKYIVSLLQLPLLYLVLCYLATIGMVGSWLWAGVSVVSLGIAWGMVKHMVVIGRRVKQWRLVK